MSASAGVPADAVAVVVNITATVTGTGYWTAFPVGQERPTASNLNIDQPGQTRAGQAIVLLSGVPAINVYSQGGGHLIVDVAGWFTGARRRSRGRTLPSRPIRPACSIRARSFAMPTGVAAPWSSRCTGQRGEVSAAAINITGTESMLGGFVTAFPIGRQSTDGIEPQRRHVGSDDRQPRHRAGQQPRASACSPNRGCTSSPTSMAGTSVPRRQRCFRRRRTRPTDRRTHNC